MTWQTLSTKTFVLALSFGEANPMVRVAYYPSNKVEYKPLCRVREWLCALSWGSRDATQALAWLDAQGRLPHQAVSQ
jgi:hypothetical protein